MSVLVSFINVGEQLLRSKEQYLLVGGDVDEGSKIVQNYFKLFVKDLSYLQSNVFEIDTGNEKKKVEFYDHRATKRYENGVIFSERAFKFSFIF